MHGGLSEITPQEEFCPVGLYCTDSIQRRTGGGIPKPDRISAGETCASMQNKISGSS